MFVQVCIPKPQRDLILKLAEVGWLYSEVHKYCESQQNRGGGVSKSVSAGNINSLLLLTGRGGKLSQSVSHSALSGAAIGR